jgi:SAM-dependent methyltransferase
VLELGCANGRLGQRFKELHPGVQWHGIDLSADAVAAARPHLDRVQQMDLDSGDLATLEGGYDTLVIGDLLEHLRHPQQVLQTLHRLSLPDARIVCCLPNMAHLSVVQRLLAGDISYDAAGLLDQTHVRFFSPSSAFKIFLDAGWLPHMQDQYRFDLPPTPFLAHLVEAAQALGIPPATTLRNLDLYQMILVCTRWEQPQTPPPGRAAAFSVIVAVNRAWQHELNIARSPGLAEVGAQLICVQGAASAAAAFADGAARARHAWRVMAHQDVYFPGSGHALACSCTPSKRPGAPVHRSDSPGWSPTRPVRRHPATPGW